MEHYNASYSELKYELNLHSKGQEKLNWSTMVTYKNIWHECLGVKGINWKGGTICKIRSNECSNTNLNRSNLKGSKVETNDATGYRRSIWTCRKKELLDLK